MARESIDFIVEEVLLPTFESMEQRQNGTYHRFPLEEVKERQGGIRNIGTMVRFREVFGEDLSTALHQNLRDLEKRGILFSDVEIAVAAKDAAWSFAERTNHYLKASVHTPKAVPLPTRSALRRQPSPRNWARVPFVRRILDYLGSPEKATRNYNVTPTPRQIPQIQTVNGGRGPTPRDRLYYANILYDSLVLVTLTDPHIRKYLRQERTTNPCLSDFDYLQREIRKELSGFKDNDIIKMDRGDRPEDKRLLAGLRAVNAVMKTVEAFTDHLSYDSFKQIVWDLSSFMNPEIEQATGFTLSEEEFVQVISLCKPRLVGHEIEVAVEQHQAGNLLEKVVARGSLRSGDTRIGPYSSTPTQRGPYGGDEGPAPIILTRDMRRLRPMTTVQDSAFLAALNLRLDTTVARRVSTLMSTLEALGVRNGNALEVIAHFGEFNPDTSLEEYLERYDVDRGPPLFEIAASLAQDQQFMNAAYQVAEVLRRRSQAKAVKRNTNPEKEKEEAVIQKYRALGLTEVDAKAIARYELRIVDPTFTPTARNMEILIEVIYRAATTVLKESARNGHFDQETYATRLEWLFQGITPDHKEGVPNNLLDEAWKKAYDRYEAVRQHLEIIAQRTTKQEIEYNILGRVVGKMQRIHSHYSELKGRSKS